MFVANYLPFYFYLDIYTVASQNKQKNIMLNKDESLYPYKSSNTQRYTHILHKKSLALPGDYKTIYYKNIHSFYFIYHVFLSMHT